MSNDNKGDKDVAAEVASDVAYIKDCLTSIMGTEWINKMNALPKATPPIDWWSDVHSTAASLPEGTVFKSDIAHHVRELMKAKARVNPDFIPEHPILELVTRTNFSSASASPGVVGSERNLWRGTDSVDAEDIKTSLDESLARLRAAADAAANVKTCHPKIIDYISLISPSGPTPSAELMNSLKSFVSDKVEFVIANPRSVVNMNCTPDLRDDVPLTVNPLDDLAKNVKCQLAPSAELMAGMQDLVSSAFNIAISRPKSFARMFIDDLPPLPARFPSSVVDRFDFENTPDFLTPPVVNIPPVPAGHRSTQYLNRATRAKGESRAQPVIVNLEDPEEIHQFMRKFKGLDRDTKGEGVMVSVPKYDTLKPGEVKMTYTESYHPSPCPVRDLAKEWADLVYRPVDKERRPTPTFEEIQKALSPVIGAPNTSDTRDRILQILLELGAYPTSMGIDLPVHSPDTDVRLWTRVGFFVISRAYGSCLAVKESSGTTTRISVIQRFASRRLAQVAGKKWVKDGAYMLDVTFKPEPAAHKIDLTSMKRDSPFFFVSAPNDALGDGQLKMQMLKQRPALDKDDPNVCQFNPDGLTSGLRGDNVPYVHLDDVGFFAQPSDVPADEPQAATWVNIDPAAVLADTTAYVVESDPSSNSTPD